MFQLNVKSAFLYDDLSEVYMEQLPLFKGSFGVQAKEGNLQPQAKSMDWFDKFSRIVREAGF